MGQSKRKHPFCGITTSESEKRDKQIESRKYRMRLRRIVAVALSLDGVDGPSTDAIIPKRAQAWMSKDGKKRFDPAKYPAMMRK